MGPEGPADTEGGPGPHRPSARSRKAHPRCPGSPPAGRSSLRMSRRCCVASSMSMLAQEEAMGPAAGASSAPRSFRCRCAPCSRAQPCRDQTAGHRSLGSVHPQPANRRPRRVPVPHQPHQPPPLPALRSAGSRNLRGVEKKGSGLGAEASPLPDPLVNGSSSRLRQSKSARIGLPKPLFASGHPVQSMSIPRTWTHDGPGTGSTQPPRLQS